MGETSDQIRKELKEEDQQPYAAEDPPEDPREARRREKFSQLHGDDGGEPGQNRQDRDRNDQ